MAVRVAQEFPLFPLDLVALPSEAVPLHIFEERYKTMLQVCLRQPSELGILWLSEDGLREVGCACEVCEVLERFPDGRMNILARGTRPFRLIERAERLAYPSGTVEFVEDDDEAADAELGRAAREAYAELVRRAADREVEQDELERMGAYDMAATIDFGREAKQTLLQLRSENARLGLLARLIRAALRQIELTAGVRERALSNGKVRFR